MIKYSLRCAAGHRFDSWFANAEAFDSLARAGHVTCALCGSGEVRKDIMAPRIASGDTPAPPPEAAPPAPGTPDTAPQAMPDLKALREKIERESHYVGASFVKEARAMHAGETPHRSIYGEARLDEARALLQDGVPVAPLPFIPTKKAN